MKFQILQNLDIIVDIMWTAGIKKNILDLALLHLHISTKKDVQILIALKNT